MSRFFFATMNDTAHTIIFIGPQGAGKGTQRALLAEYINEHSEKDTLVFDAGASFRAVMATDGYVPKRMQEYIGQGELLPYVFPIIFWGQTFLEKLTPKRHLIIDGSPRTRTEADALDTAFTFFERERVTVIHLTLPEEESVRRLTERARADDTPESIKRRLATYHTETETLLSFFADRSDRYHVVAINGDQTREAVLSDIIDTITS